MNNIKMMQTKETIMKNNNFTEGVTQKQSNRKMLEKYTVHRSDLQIQPKAIILKSHLFIGALHRIHRIPSEYRPLGIPRNKMPVMFIICLLRFNILVVFHASLKL